jgi:anti-anti-sigma factor
MKRPSLQYRPVGWNPFKRKAVSTRLLAGALAAMDLAGDVDGRRAPEVARALADLLAQGRTRIIVGCAAVTFFDVEGIGAILAELARIRRAGGDVKLFGLSPDVSRLLLDEMGLEGPIETHATETQALGAFAADTRAARPIAEDRFWVRTEPKSGVPVVWLEGALDRPADGKRFAEAVHAVEAAGHRKLVLECGDLLWASSAGLGQIVSAAGAFTKANGRVGLVGPLGAVQTIWLIMRLDAIFERHETLEQAVAALR